MNQWYLYFHPTSNCPFHHYPFIIWLRDHTPTIIVSLLWFAGVFVCDDFQLIITCVNAECSIPHVCSKGWWNAAHFGSQQADRRSESASVFQCRFGRHSKNSCTNGCWAVRHHCSFSLAEQRELANRFVFERIYVALNMLKRHYYTAVLMLPVNVARFLVLVVFAVLLMSHLVFSRPKLK